MNVFIITFNSYICIGLCDCGNSGYDRQGRYKLLTNMGRNWTWDVSVAGFQNSHCQHIMYYLKIYGTDLILPQLWGIT